jgi:hypothetical protein
MSVNTVIRYFDLQSARRAVAPEAQAGTKQRLPVLWQYVALVLGILVQPLLAKYAATKTWDLGAVPGWIPFAIIIGLVIFPGVYKKAANPGANPLFVQLCAIFASGIGWQSLVAVAGKGIGV